MKFLLLLLVLTSSDSPAAPVPEYDFGQVDSLHSMGVLIGLKRAAETHPPLIRIKIDSPGGDVDVMLQLIYAAKKARAGGTKIECTVSGMAASAGAVFYEAACDVRIMTRGSQLMFHECAAGMAGKSGDFRRAADEMEATDKRVAAMIAWRLGMTGEEYLAWIHDRNQWLDTAEALKRGAIDEVRP